MVGPGSILLYGTRGGAPETPRLGGRAIRSGRKILRGDVCRRALVYRIQLRQVLLPRRHMAS
jgi:hypothetical protein